MKVFLFLLVMVTTLQFASAKNYNNAIGLKGGNGGAITYRHFFGNDNALELDLYGGEGWFLLSGNYQWNVTTSAKQFEYYYGIGGQVVSISNASGWGSNANSMIFGINGMFGIEYSLKEIPLVFSLDINPMYSFGNSGVLYWNGGIGIKYYW